MEKQFILEETLATDLNQVMPLVERIAQKVLALTASAEETFQVKLALEEALTNAMRHGNLLIAKQVVTVKVKASRERIILDIHDQGKGFDFSNLRDPTRGENTGRISGRGVFLMRKLMDDIEFYDAGSGVKMVKTFRLRPGV